MSTVGEVRVGQGELLVLDASGDTKLMWDSSRPEEVIAAKKLFEELRKKQYLAFRAEGREGTKGSQINDFDSELERIIMVPRMVGG